MSDSRTSRAAAFQAARERAMARTPAQAFRHGLLQSLPFQLVIIPFGLLFGVAASAAGVTLAQSIGFSTLVLAGASQFTAVQLLADNAPVWLVILSSLVVNLRMAMYSASLVPYLGGASTPARAAIAYALIDQSYALSISHYQDNPALTMPQRLGYFAGTAVPLCLSWMVMSIVGATVGQAIPDSFALDFAVPICFLAMIAPALRSAPHVAAATVGVIVALLLSSLPAGVNLMVAAPAAMLTGAYVEVLLARRSGGRA